MRFARIIIFLLFVLISTSAYAVTVEPQAYGSEKRIKYWRYYPKMVFKYTGFLNIPAYIEFEAGEVVQNISTSVEDKWIFDVQGSKLFLKPIAEDGDTISIVLTNKRTYFFEFHVKNARNPFDQRLAFGTAFQYPKEADGGEGGAQETTIIKYATSKLPDLSKPQTYNFNYTMAGADLIAPIKVFDDGQFTYLEFRNKNGVLPAFFGVDSKGYEYILNFRVVGDYVILESVPSIITLRNGADTVCVFNESAKKTEQSIEAAKKRINPDVKLPFEPPPMPKIPTPDSMKPQVPNDMVKG